jgi:hypothetical protein
MFQILFRRIQIFTELQFTTDLEWQGCNLETLETLKNSQAELHLG